MISAQNRLLPSSGNRVIQLIVVFVFTISISSCELFKPVQKPDDKDNNTQLDPVIGKNKRPKQSTEIILKPEDVKVVDWRKPTSGEVLPPISDGSVVVNPGDNNNNNNNNPNDSGTTIVNPGILKGSYNISVMMPFFTDKFTESTTTIPTESERSLRFYEGLLLGIRQLEAETHDLNISVYDTKRDPGIVAGLLSSSDVTNADLVIGPVDAKTIKLVSNFSKEYSIPMAPLNSSSSIADENRYYIQSSPAFDTHAQSMVKYMNQRFAGRNTVMIARNNASEINRFSTFHNAQSMYGGGGNRFKEYTVKGDSKSYTTTDLKDYLVEGDTSIIIIPSWNEGFISSIMRDLSILRRRYPVVVFGMPLWDNFQKIDVDYYENLNLHITSSTFIDKQAEEVKKFRQDFFDEYGIVPTDEAFKGYDFIVYFGRLLKKYGTGFPYFLEEDKNTMMHTTVTFEPMFSSNSTEGNYIIDRFENRQVYILSFDEYQFNKVSEGSPTITTSDGN